MKKVEKSSSAGTEVESSTNAHSSQVSQPNANTNVVGSLFKSREIKFRVWDEDNSIMIHDDGREQVDISFYGGKSVVIHHFTEHTIEREGTEMDVPVSDLVPKFILMQYIGLLDKNVKEIYEGDILENDNGVKYIVVWIEQLCGFYLSLPNSQRGKEIISCAASKVSNDPMLLFKDAVIGNIFENPELLQTLR